MQNNNLPEHYENLIQSAVERMENVILPMQKFVYPKPLQLHQIPPRIDFRYSVFEFDTVILENGEIKAEHKSAMYFFEDLGQNVSLEMIYIPGSTFMMGASEEDGYEVPQHQVHIDAFHIGKFEITQQQWTAIMHHNLSANQGADLPVENVSWYDAIEFCSRLSIITGRHYRLPSEAEWEYACRAGTTTSFGFGSEITTQLANYWDINATDNSTVDSPPPSEGCIAAYSPDSVEYLQTRRVGSFFPNAFGLYDMHGNVYEFCQDTWHDNYNDAPNDGSAWGSGGNVDSVVIRGGSFDYYEDDCRSAYRSETGANYRYHGTGFRVVCSLNGVAER
jgi:formylglycine-generating enzyme required for sulfatase activity